MKKTKAKRRTRGSGTLFKRGAGYCVRWKRDGTTFQRILRDADGNPIKNREKAEAAAAELIHPWTAADRADRLALLRAREDRQRTEADRLKAEANPPPGISSAWFAFEASPSKPDCGESTLARYSAHFDDFKKWLTRERPGVEHLHQVTNADAKAYAANLNARKLAAGTFNQRVNLLSMVWRVLADDFRLTSDPWSRELPESKRIARKKLQSDKQTARRQALTPGQFNAVLAAAEADPDARDLLTLLGWTGLRMADGVLLKWSSVDFEKSIIIVMPIKTARRYGKIIRVPLFPDSLDVLNRRSDGKVLDGRAFVFPEMAAQYQRDRSAVQKRLRAFFEKAGLTTSETRAGRARAVVAYGVHSTRHFFATEAATAGIPEAVVRHILGHADSGQTEHYTHIEPELVAKLAANIGTGKKALPSDTKREALPTWAREIIEGMTAESFEQKRTELLAVE